MPNRENVKDLVIFRAGKYRHGEYSESQLDEIVSSFNEQSKPAVIIGHSSDYKGHTRIPAFGVISGLKRIGKELVATSAEFSKQLVEWIKEGFYTDRSVEIGNDPATGKLRLYALGMLGAASPEVKGMPSMEESLQEISMQYSEDIPNLVMMSEDANVTSEIDIVEQMGKDDTLEAIREDFAICLSNIENILAMDNYDQSKLYNELSSCYDSISSEINLHFSFLQKIENIEEGKEGEMSEKKNKILEFFSGFNKKRKEQIEMDAQKEKEFLDKIATLEATNKEFAEKEAKRIEDLRLADEAKAKAELEAKDNALRLEIKQFCESNKLNTKKFDDMKIQDLMFNVAKSNLQVEFSEGNAKTSLEVFKEILQNVPTAPEGEKDFGKDISSNARPKNLEFAEAYYTDHKKDFTGMKKEQAIGKILVDIINDKIKIS